MRILLTNDDGIDAPGLAAMYEAIAAMGDVQVVAPAKVQSATSHAITFHRPIHVKEKTVDLPGGGSFTGMAVDGRPADCVKLALDHLTPGPVDLVISGMNAGANVGINVIYSGTVAAAREAAFIGVPAIAVSLHLGDRTAIRWSLAAAHARRAIDRVLLGPFQRHALININVPILDHRDEPRGMKVARISTSSMVTEYEIEPQGDDTHTYQVCNGMTFREVADDTDARALLDGYLTLTPLHFDLTDTEQLAAWRGFVGPG